MGDADVLSIPSTQIQFDKTLNIGHNIIDVNFTHNPALRSWIFTFKAAQTIKLVDLIVAGIDDIGLVIPDSIAGKIDDILTINIDSFYILYTEGDDSTPETVTFSNDGTLSLFDISVSNITVSCSKPPKDTTWSYTVSFSLPSPCTPLSTFSGGIPGLGGIQILDGKFAFFKGTPSSAVVGIANSNPAPTQNSVTCSGSLVIGGNDFMNLVHSIVKVDQVDVAILPGVVKIDIPPSADGVNLIIFTAKSFNLQIMLDGFGVGATIELQADWLSKKAVDGSFLLTVEIDGAFGAQVNIVEIFEPFGLPGMSLKNTGFSLAWLAEAEEPQSLSANGDVVFTNSASDLNASFAFSMDETNPSTNFFRMDVENMTLPDLINTMTFGHIPPPLDKTINSDILKIGFKSLEIDLEPSNDIFSFNADFYVSSLEGKVAASVDMEKGITFGTNLNAIDILGLVQIHASNSNDTGPFTYLDTTVADSNSVLTIPPPWVGVTSIDDAVKKGNLLDHTAFAFSGSLDLLSMNLDVYGLINSQGLDLAVSKSKNRGVPGVDFTVSEKFDIAISDTQLQVDTSIEYKFGIDVPDFDFLGVSLGSFNQMLVDSNNDLALTVTYAVTGWQNDDMKFLINIAADVLGLPPITATLTLDASVTSISQLPSKIASFVTDQVVSFIENQVASPFIKGWDAAKQAANEAIKALTQEYNALASDVLSILSAAGHEIAAIAAAMNEILSMSLDEVASSLIDFGRDINEVGSILSDAFAATPSEIASGLASAGITVEHAVEAGFGEVGAELSKDFGFVGNSIAGFAESGAEAVEQFAGAVEGDLSNFGGVVISELGNVADSVGDALSSGWHAVTSVCCVS